MLLQEDAKLIQLVSRYGSSDWASISQHLPGRSGSKCLSRWNNTVNPAIDHSPWRPEEDEIIIEVIVNLICIWYLTLIYNITLYTYSGMQNSVVNGQRSLHIYRGELSSLSEIDGIKPYPSSLLAATPLIQPPLGPSLCLNDLSPATSPPPPPLQTKTSPGPSATRASPSPRSSAY